MYVIQLDLSCHTKLNESILFSVLIDKVWKKYEECEEKLFVPNYTAYFHDAI